MGSWGTAIYSCDIAEDVRDACQAIFAFYDVEEGNKRIFSIFDDIVNQTFVDNEYASFWYALSDWQWKHGMLNTNVKEKTINLLDSYTGLDEWDRADLAKRRKVLDQLKKQLHQPQPNIKKPRAKVSKPKHTPGDIIVFHISTEEKFQESSKLRIRSLVPPFFFQSTNYRNSQYQSIEGYDAGGQWMALLCIGSVKEKYSEYVDNVFEEYSLYVWYDYLYCKPPSINDLRMCGFLPYIDWTWKDFNKNIIDNLHWGYEFTLICEKFKKSSTIDSLFAFNEFSEVTRYKNLTIQKDYSPDYYGAFSILDMFSTIFAEKNRAMIIGEIYDNLLNNNIYAPKLLSSEEATANLQKYIKSLN